MSEINLEDLKTPFDPSLISWRVGATTKDKKKAIPLAYIDARDVMERLDEVCGMENWQCRYSHANGKTIAEIGIRINGEWVWKANGAGDTQVEAEKGAISDAMKRAAVLWGIGRYLYDVPNIWVEIDQYRKISNPNDPRLAKALEEAAKGIRGVNEPEPQEEIIPLTGEEFTALQTEIRDCKSHADLNTVRTKANSAIARMTKQQKDTVRLEIGKMFDGLVSNNGAAESTVQ